DFNGDEMTDILWYNTNTGQAVIWLLNGATVIGGGSPGSVASPWQGPGTGAGYCDGATGRPPWTRPRRRGETCVLAGSSGRYVGDRRRIAWFGGEPMDDCRNRRLQQRRHERHPLVEQYDWAGGVVVLERHDGDRRRFARLGGEPMAGPRHER